MKKENKCEYCEGEIEYHRIMARFNYRGDTIYVHNVPALVCSKCGGQYFDAPVYRHLEDIAKHHSRIKKKISFPLAEYKIAIS